MTSEPSVKGGHPGGRGHSSQKLHGHPAVGLPASSPASECRVGLAAQEGGVLPRSLWPSSCLPWQGDMGHGDRKGAQDRTAGAPSPLPPASSVASTPQLGEKREGLQGNHARRMSRCLHGTRPQPAVAQIPPMVPSYKADPKFTPRQHPHLYTHTCTHPCNAYTQATQPGHAHLSTHPGNTSPIHTPRLRPPHQATHTQAMHTSRQYTHPSTHPGNSPLATHMPVHKPRKHTCSHVHLSTNHTNPRTYPMQTPICSQVLPPRARAHTRHAHAHSYTTHTCTYSPTLSFTHTHTGPCAHPTPPPPDTQLHPCTYTHMPTCVHIQPRVHMTLHTHVYTHTMYVHSLGTSTHM